MTLDLSGTSLAVLIAYLLRFNFFVPEQYRFQMFLNVVFIVLIRFLSLYFSKIHLGIVRYTASKDIQRIFNVNILVTVFFALFNIVTLYTHKEFFIPYSIVIIEFMTTLFFMLGYRIVIKMLYFEMKNPEKEKRKIIASRFRSR
jgi:FlaA1/EpsC-like NDP-sugar epimerase